MVVLLCLLRERDLESSLESFLESFRLKRLLLEVAGLADVVLTVVGVRLLGAVRVPVGVCSRFWSENALKVA